MPSRDPSLPLDRAHGDHPPPQVLSLLLPLRFDLRRLGGSWAQRQVFSTTIIQAAIHAGDLHLAMDLVAELKVCGVM